MRFSLTTLLLWLLLAMLIVLHQDYWHWDDARLVMGFLPYQLFYHACLSLAAAALWLFAVQFCWPRELSEEDIEKDEKR